MACAAAPCEMKSDKGLHKKYVELQYLREGWMMWRVSGELTLIHYSLNLVHFAFHGLENPGKYAEYCRNLIWLL